MDTKYKLTVIIPVYNTEKYLKRCIDSVLNQTLKSIKLVIVNDASTDNSSYIIHQFEKYNQIQIVENTINLGQGESRNIGINLIDSDYFCFLDSDDWVDTKAYENAINALEVSSSSGAAIFGIKTEYENSSCSSIRYDYLYNIIDGGFAVSLLSRELNQDSPISALLGNKVFRTSLILNDNLRFSNLFYEDTVFSFKALLKCPKVILLPQTYLHYYQREGSIMHTFSNKYIDDLIENFVELKDYLIKNNKLYLKQYYAYFDKCCSSMLNAMFCSIQNAIEQKKFINHLFDQIISKMNVEDLINYVDVNRIKKLLY